jgi:ATP-dependent protease HslVU (ClpYQ) ATPase subunit
MAKTLEQLADEIFKECLEDGEPVTKEEALKMAQMELGAKQIKNYAQSTPTKKKVTREIKVDDTKVELIAQISKLLDKVVINNSGLDDICITKVQREIDFTLCNEHYTLTLVKHRPPKK